MQFTHVIQDILRSKGVNPYEANKTIFGIATIGLLVGKETLDSIVHDLYYFEDREVFENEIMRDITKDDETEIAQTAFEFIPGTIDNKTLIKITDIILGFDLNHMVFGIPLYAYKNTIYAPPSNIQWINQLVAEILKIHGGKTVFNSDCGTGEFLTYIIDKGISANVIGSTLNREYLSIVKIKSYFSKNNFDVKLSKLFSTALTDDEKVDMIYNSYPFGSKYEDKGEVVEMINSWDFEFDLKRKYSVDLLLIINALQSIKNDGIVVALVPNGVLFNEIDVDIRRYLVTNHFITSIISLPSGIIYPSGITASLVILQKHRANHNNIRMIDATRICTVERRYKNFTEENIQQIITLYTEVENTDYSIDVNCEEIALNDFYLGFNRYYHFPLKNSVILNSVSIGVFRGYQMNARLLDEISIDDYEESDYRIINISDVKTEGIIAKDLKSIRVDDESRVRKYCVKEGDIIITAKNTTIKTAIYRGERGYKAILSGNLIAIRADASKLNPYYLKAFLDSEQGQNMLKSIQTGTSIISINANNLKNMEISLLPMEQQSVIANEYIKNLNLIEDILQKYNEVSENMRNIYNRLSKTK